MPDQSLDLRAENDRLTAENTRLAALARQAGMSATLQAYRADAFHGEAQALLLAVRAMRTSFFWRLTAPLRVALDLARGDSPAASPEAILTRRFLAVARQEGLGAAWRRMRRYRAHQRKMRALPPLPRGCCRRTWRAPMTPRMPPRPRRYWRRAC